VIVDTTLPRIDQLRVQAAANGGIEIQARVADSNLDPNTWKFEWQADPAAAWQPVALQGATVQPIGNTGLPLGGSLLRAFWQPPAATRPVAVRGMVMDRAGNSATYQARLDGAQALSGPLLTSPSLSTTAATPAIPPNAPSQAAVSLPSANALQASGAAQGWASAGAAANSATQTAQSGQPTQATASPASQPWPAANASRAPFQLWTTATAVKDDGVTAYGSPPLFAAPQASVARTEPTHNEQRVEARYAGITKAPSDLMSGTVSTASSRPQFATLEPYREPAADSPVTPSTAPVSVSSSNPIVQEVTPIASSISSSSPPSPPK
jgi:hypothetical protein